MRLIIEFLYTTACSGGMAAKKKV